MKKQNIICKICNDFIARSQSFYFHLRDKHNITVKQYYDEFLKKGNEGKCKECGKKTEFLTIMQGYRKFCSRKCQNKNETLRNQRKLTCLKKYGRICAINQKKSRKTKQKRYGDPNFNNQLKARETKEKKYGDPTYNNRKKYSKTVFKRYGYYYHTQIPEFIKNLKEHCKNRTEKQRKKIKSKTNKTRLKKYGEKNYGLYGSKSYRLNLKKNMEKKIICLLVHLNLLRNQKKLEK